MNESHAVNTAWKNQENISREHFQSTCLRVPPHFSDRDKLIKGLKRIDSGLANPGTTVDKTILEVSYDMAFSLVEHCHYRGEIARAVTSTKLEQKSVAEIAEDLSNAIRNTISFLESDGINPEASDDWDREDFSIRKDLTMYGSPRGRMLLLWSKDALDKGGVDLSGAPIWADPVKEDPHTSPYYSESEYVPNPRPMAKG